MDKAEVLSRLNDFRDSLNNWVAGPWVNKVLAHLDEAIDELEDDLAGKSKSFS